ncbi:MAG: PQQ-binding-like beta-propeller repeat protein [Nitrospirota bacterium]
MLAIFSRHFIRFLLSFCLFLVINSSIIFCESLDSSLAATFLTSQDVRPGICVIINCKDGGLFGEIARYDKHLIHGLVSEFSDIDGIRKYLDEHGLYGQVAVEGMDYKRLPYADNLVNLAVVEDIKGAINLGLSIKEVMRILCPNGIGYLGQRPGGGISEGDLRSKLYEAGVEDFEIISVDGLWAKVKKARPIGMDEWCQRRYGADRNAVSKDTVLGVANSIRWLAGPEYPRGHRKNHTLGAVSSNGRNFYYTVNSASNMNLPPQKAGERDRYYLLARDAYNGLFLWEKPWEYGSWWESGYRFDGGPVALAADKERVFAATTRNCIEILEASTGRSLNIWRFSSMPQEIALIKGKVVVRTEDQICKMDIESGVKDWECNIRAGSGRYGGGGQGFAVGEEGIFVLDTSDMTLDIVCISLSEGKEKWRVSPGSWDEPFVVENRGLYLIWLYKNGFLVLGTPDGNDKRIIRVLSAGDGHHVWRTPQGEDYDYDDELIVYIDDLLWVYNKGAIEMLEGRDISSGEIKKRVNVSIGWSEITAACGIPIATDRYIIGSKFFNIMDRRTGKFYNFLGGCGACQFYNIAANGLLYLYPTCCNCRGEYFYRGFMGASSEELSLLVNNSDSLGRLVKGIAYSDTDDIKFTVEESDWPFFCHDGERSCFASTEVSFELEAVWKKKLADRPYGYLKYDLSVNQMLGDPLSAPVVAGGMVFVALIDKHTVVCLDAETGEERWSYIAGGRIDSPPSIYKGLCIFGSNNGWIL